MNRSHKIRILNKLSKLRHFFFIFRNKISNINKKTFLYCKHTTQNKALKEKWEQEPEMVKDRYKDQCRKAKREFDEKYGQYLS